VSRMAWMKIVFGAALCVMARPASAQQQVGAKFVQDTIVVEAEGSFEADPDLATLTFDVTSQDKDMKKAYDVAAQSMQRIVDLAQKSGIKKEDVSTGVLTLTPSYERDKNKAKSYTVKGILTVKVRDFSQVGPLVEGAVQEGIVDFRSLSYSLQDEEGAKQKAVAAAMKNAVGRATAALAQTGQKAGAIRYASVDVRHLETVTRMPGYITMDSVQSLGVVGQAGRARAPATLPSLAPEKIAVSATVQCAFQIQ
jgi:uncharacterized protein YggE